VLGSAQLHQVEQDELGVFADSKGCCV